eukprot:434651_1
MALIDIWGLSIFLSCSQKDCFIFPSFTTHLMSSKSSRRRQRKSKQKAKIANKPNCDYADKFKIIEKDISNLLVCAYIRQIKPHGRVNMHMVPYEIQNICVCYFNDESIKTKWIETVILPLIR